MNMEAQGSTPAWFTEACQSRLGAYQFDIFQRYTFLRHLLSLIVPHTSHPSSAVSILDVGSGPSRLTEEFLGSWYKVTRADVIPCSDPEVVRLDANKPLPFSDKQFEFVLALDVLEHVPADQREPLIRQCTRVSEHAVILSCPDGDPEVRAAEQRVADAYVHLFRQQNQFLAEHTQYGAPEAQAVVDTLDRMGAAHLVINNIPLQLWEAYTLMDFFLISSAELFDLKQSFTRKLNSRGPAWFANGPHYRKYYAIFQSSSVRDEVSKSLGLNTIPETQEYSLGAAWELARLLADSMLSEDLLGRQKTQLAQLLNAKDTHISALEGVIRQSQFS